MNGMPRSREAVEGHIRLPERPMRDGKMKLALYFAPGACSRVPLIALEEIGQPFDGHLVTFMKGEHRAPDYLALNPAGKVPTLVAVSATYGRREKESSLII